ncbi:MAG: NUDIX domain-containing protein [Patescibacteria group bacterium]
MRMDYPGIGTGVWIRKDNKVLLGLRTGKFGTNTWCIPGGKLEMFEAWDDGARREVLEETGIKIKDMRFVAVLDDQNKDIGMHYLTIHFVADWVSGEARVMEPEKFARWEWFAYDALPAPLFPPTRNFVDKGYNPFTI